MPAKKRAFKEKPSMTTVKESFKVSDLLRVEVCDPIRKQIDQIKVCTPNLKEPVMCLPDRICRPYRLCLPDLFCRPKIFCKPDIWCRPIIVCGPDIWCGPTVYEIPEEIPFEMREVLEELQTIKAEIAELKKAIKW